MSSLFPPFRKARKSSASSTPSEVGTSPGDRASKRPESILSSTSTTASRRSGFILPAPAPRAAPVMLSAASIVGFEDMPDTPFSELERMKSPTQMLDTPKAGSWLVGGEGGRGVLTSASSKRKGGMYGSLGLQQPAGNGARVPSNSSAVDNNLSTTSSSPDPSTPPSPTTTRRKATLDSPSNASPSSATNLLQKIASSSQPSRIPIPTRPTSLSSVPDSPTKSRRLTHARTPSSISRRSLGGRDDLVPLPMPADREHLDPRSLLPGEGIALEVPPSIENVLESIGVPASPLLHEVRSTSEIGKGGSGAITPALTPQKAESSTLKLSETNSVAWPKDSADSGLETPPLNPLLPNVMRPRYSLSFAWEESSLLPSRISFQPVSPPASPSSKATTANSSPRPDHKHSRRSSFAFARDTVAGAAGYGIGLLPKSVSRSRLSSFWDQGSVPQGA